MRALRSVSFMMAALLAPASADAQFRPALRPDLSDSATRACVAALPPSDLKPTVVWLGASSGHARDSAAAKALFLLAQDVATRMRAQLGAPEGVVPRVDASIPWTAVWGALDGELHADGTVTIEPDTARNEVDSLALVGSHLIERALKSLLSEGELWPYVPTEWAISWPFRLYLAAPDATVENTALPTWRSAGIPVFTRSMPAQAALGWAKDPEFPTAFFGWAETAEFADSLTLRFDYDAKGRVVDESVREVPYRDDTWGYGATMPPRFARPMGGDRARAKTHASMFAAAKRSLKKVRWTDGRIGSCPLPRVAYQSFTLRFKDRP